MIFQSLITLYDRLAETGNVPPYGFSIEDIGFVITIDKEGNLLDKPEDLRTPLGSQKYDFRTSEVPYTNQVNVRSGNAATTPNFMVDKADYIFGISGSAGKEKYRNSFTGLIYDVCGESDDVGVVAVKNFLGKWKAEDSTELEGWKDICGTHGKMVALRLDGDADFVHERPAVRELWSSFIKHKEYAKGVSFVDGDFDDLQPQYAQFPFGTGASLVSFKNVSRSSRFFN